MKRKILIVGASGFIGKSLFQYLNNNNSYEVLGTYFKNKLKNLKKLDYNDSQSIDDILNKFKPKTIIWCAGIKNLNETEKSKKLTWQHNVDSIKNISAYIKSYPLTHFIFLSTDYVFDGKRGNYDLDDHPNPTTIYGKSKWEAEKYTQKTIPRYSILRTSAVIGVGSPFFDWVCNSISQKKEIILFNNIFTPTPIILLVESIESLLNFKKSETHHFCGFENFSRFDIGVLVGNLMKCDKQLIKKDASNNSDLFQENLSMISSIQRNEKLYLKDFIKSEIKKYENN